MPYAVCAQPVTQQRSQRHDENNIPAQRDDQRFCALAQTLQRTGGGGGHRRDDKTDADDAQGSLPGGDGFGVLGEQPHQLPGGKLTDDRARRHDGCTHEQGQLEQLFHPGVLPRTVVVANEGAHALHEAVGGQIQKGLQFIIDAQHHHVALRKGRQQSVEEGDQQRGQRQIQDRRNADGVQSAVQHRIRAQAAAAQPHRQLSAQVDHKVDHHAEHLTDAGCQCRACNAHGGHRPQPEDEHRVQQNIAHAAGDQGNHGHLHAAHRLKDLLKRQRDHVHDQKQEHDGGVSDTCGDQPLVLRKAAQKAGHDGDADRHHHHAVHKAEHKAVGSGRLGLFAVTRAQIQRDHGIDADAKADGNGVGKVLDGEHQT